MQNLYLFAFEAVVFGLLILCFRHAWKQGLPVVWQLLAGVLFGLLLEWATIHQLQAYHYGPFAIMWGKVPVAVGVGWGVIIYSVRLFSDSTNLSVWARPVLDGLLALNIDLAMDAVAIRLGMWNWGIGFERQYFGVPFANFWAWFWVVFSFSLALRFFGSMDISFRRWLAPLGAIFCGALGVVVTNALIVSVVPRAWYVPIVFSTLGGALWLILALRPRFYTRAVDPLVFWVPFAFHLSFLVAGLISRAILNPPALLLVSMVMAGLALYLHRPTVLGIGSKAA